ncbi:MAG: Gfo/Idh/MocA family oxidoreductase [Chthoniobacter sp.]|uniref:Gfo/Idh/MocA family oxidoreductase n=1 Tax=Chthoniobacter sp. TaxID=2510640 RepID=UPI0032AB929E
MKTPLSRRSFLTRTSAAAVGLGLSARVMSRAQGANERVVMGVIGAGGMGRSNLSGLLKVPGVEFAAVCDVDKAQQDKALEILKKEGRPEPKVYGDFREVLDRKDIDAVLIATPDHWHAIPFIAACEAGKDIYCEKPISHDLTEARAMLGAAQHFNRVVQIGTWQRSVKHFQTAIDFVRSGQMGEIAVCRAWFVSVMGGWPKPMEQVPDGAAPDGFNYDMWLGPAPKRPYNSNRAHWNWRWYYDYGGGLVTDWGVHMMDMVFQGMQQSDPVTVSCEGGIYVLKDGRDTPDTMQAIYRFPNFLMNWETRFSNGRGLDGGRTHGAEFIGSKGTLIVDRTDYQWFPEHPDNPGPKAFEKSPPHDHWQNFIDCVKSRAKPRSDIYSMAKTTMCCHLANIAYQSGRTVVWSPKKLDVANAHAVRDCKSYTRPYRAPWKLPTYPVTVV